MKVRNLAKSAWDIKEDRVLADIADRRMATLDRKASRFSKRDLFLLTAIICLLSLPGCGFLLHGGKQEITFDSKPPGAAVTLDHAMQFVTPRTLSLPRASSHQAIFMKHGYEPQRIMIKNEFLIGPSIIGNLLPLFPVGLAIDVLTGAAWGFEQDYIAVDMTKSRVGP